MDGVHQSGGQCLLVVEDLSDVQHPTGDRQADGLRKPPVRTGAGEDAQDRVRVGRTGRCGEAIRRSQARASSQPPP